jgi:hypothetical protein
MAQEVKYNTNHHAGPNAQARINSRERNSGGEEADQIVKSGTGPRRVFHNIHNPGSARQHGADNAGEGDLFGNKRGPANPKGQY